METLDLLKQQGNQAGPEILKAVQNGEIAIELAEKAFENGNQCSPDILEALQENDGENIQKAFEQGNQAMPNIIDAYEAGEIGGGGGDSKKVSISPYLMDEYNFRPTTDLCNNFYEYHSASAGQGNFTNSVNLCLITEKESYESIKLIANGEEYSGNIVGGTTARELTQQDAEYLIEINGEESREYFYRKIGQYYWQAEFPSVPLTENTDVTVVADGEESDSYNLKVNKPLKLTAGDTDAKFTITARYYNNPPSLFVSTDGINWPYRQWGYNSQSESYGTEIQIPANTSVYLCGIENTYNELNKYTTFNAAIQFGKIEMSGDLWTLVNRVGGNAKILADNTFKNLFKYMLNLVKAPDINNINTRAGIYENMFTGVNTDFIMSNDGTNFNFAFAPQLPVTFGDNTYGTYREIANLMGNTNGFTTPE